MSDASTERHARASAGTGDVTRHSGSDRTHPPRFCQCSYKNCACQVDGGKDCRCRETHKDGCRCKVDPTQPCTCKEGSSKECACKSPSRGSPANLDHDPHSRQQSPRHSLGQESPRHSLGHESPRHSLGQESPRHSLGHESPRHSLRHESPRHSKGEESPRHSLGHESPRQGEGHETPRQDEGQHSPRHSRTETTYQRDFMDWSGTSPLRPGEAYAANRHYEKGSSLPHAPRMTSDIEKILRIFNRGKGGEHRYLEHSHRNTPPHSHHRKEKSESVCEECLRDAKGTMKPRDSPSFVVLDKGRCGGNIVVEHKEEKEHKDMDQGVPRTLLHHVRHRIETPYCEHSPDPPRNLYHHHDCEITENMPDGSPGTTVRDYCDRMVAVADSCAMAATPARPCRRGEDHLYKPPDEPMLTTYGVSYNMPALPPLPPPPSPRLPRRPFLDLHPSPDRAIEDYRGSREDRNPAPPCGNCCRETVPFSYNSPLPPATRQGKYSPRNPYVKEMLRPRYPTFERVSHDDLQDYYRQKPSSGCCGSVSPRRNFRYVDEEKEWCSRTGAMPKRMCHCPDCFLDPDPACNVRDAVCDYRVKLQQIKARDPVEH